MRKKWLMFVLAIVLAALTACGTGNDNTDEESDNGSDELKNLEVDFPLPETADVGETIEMKAIVTYGDEKVTDADEVEFEFWEQGNKDDSTMMDAENNEDGTYTAETSFDHDGVFEVYAHTTARDMHTMPKKTIMVGDAEADEEADSEEQEHVDGFTMNFMKLRNAKVDDDTILLVHLQMDGEPFENAEVRFEIWQEDDDNHNWVDAEESAEGEYKATNDFPEAGTYTIQIHVKDDDDLHEHEVYELEVKE